MLQKVQEEGKIPPLMCHLPSVCITKIIVEKGWFNPEPMEALIASCFVHNFNPNEKTNLKKWKLNCSNSVEKQKWKNENVTRKLICEIVPQLFSEPVSAFSGHHGLMTFEQSHVSPFPCDSVVALFSKGLVIAATWLDWCFGAAVVLPSVSAVFAHS